MATSANIGTWFVGKLQTERDKDRLLEGLQALAVAFLDLDLHDDGVAGAEVRDGLAGDLFLVQLIDDVAHEGHSPTVPPGPEPQRRHPVMPDPRRPAPRIHVLRAAG